MRGLLRIGKLLLIPILFYTLDYFGLFVHLFELSYETQFTYPLEGEVVLWATELHKGEKPKVAPINNYNFGYIHNVTHKCSNTVVSPRLMLFIKSAIRNSQRRTAIRRTWGSEHRFSDVVIRRAFLIGVSKDIDAMDRISAEAAEHHDILQADFMDTYYNNTLKTLQGLHWAAHYCSNAEHYMFVDDDYYVSIKNVLRFIRNPNGYPVSGNSKTQQVESELFAGYVMQTTPHRHKLSKWYISLREYSFDRWPPYITAGAFVLSRGALLKLYYVSLYTQLFRFDDIYLGITALKAKLKLTHCSEFHFYRPSSKELSSFSTVIASHGFDDSAELEQFWRASYTASYA